MRGSDFWAQSIDRGRYALIGAVLFAVKYNLDRWIAQGIHKRKWTWETYFLPAGGRPLQALLDNGPDAAFYQTMLLVALPFIAVGILLTLWRLNDAGLNGALAVLFFVPAVNLLFFCLLCIAPSREPGWTGPFHSSLLTRILPDHPVGSAAAAVFLVVPPAVLAVMVGTNVMATYGWGVFVGIPFGVGLAAALLYSYHRPRSLGSCLVAAMAAVTLLGLAVIVFAVEGLICVMMAAPIGYVLGGMGGIVGYFVQKARWRGFERAMAVLAIFAALPAIMGAEYAAPAEPPLIPVVTSIDIEASPTVVWQHVVTFARLAPPTEAVFRTGVAYPIEARIQGQGVGAVRYCQFTTGAFVEPITVWDAPRRLAFSVRAQPPPMEEWSPYAGINPAHLYGYLTSERGQFDLVALEGGRTRLLGTTWYRHRMWPTAYWRVWSDGILHAIHRRVLAHVKRLAEADAR